jgi:hypothetical protein
MPQVCLSIATLMVAVGLVALDTAVVRSGYLAYGSGPLLGTVPIGLVLQYAIWRSIRGSRGSRPFWLGFLASGTLAMVSFWSGFGLPPFRSGRFHEATQRLWDVYGGLVFSMTESIPGARPMSDWSQPLLNTFGLTIILVPQSLFALAGGVLLCRLWRVSLGRHPAVSVRGSARPGK